MISLIEVKIKNVLEKLSNSKYEEVASEEKIDKLIDEACSEFKFVLEKQFKRKKEEFKLRSSNIGKPTCQLQLEKKELQEEEINPLPYNHFTRMVLGDLSEIIVNFIIKLTDIKITGAKNKIKWDLFSGNNKYPVIEGEDDIELEGRVYDIKSSSPWAYENKWMKGFSGVANTDSFGYVDQLLSYSLSQNKKPGGWIVLNKSTGEITVVEFSMLETEQKQEVEKIKETIKFITEDHPFKKCFDEQNEYFYKKPTGNKKLPITCSFCNFIRHCWPDAQYLPQAKSKAQNPKMIWYTEYTEEDE